MAHEKGILEKSRNPQRHTTTEMAGTLSILFVFMYIFLLANTSTAERLAVGDFSTSTLAGWEEKVFEGKTSYRFFRLNGANVLLAESHGTASGLIKKEHVDIRKYPYLNWSWRIENRLDVENEKIKSGDDYAARIYVVIDGGILVWRTRALSYVWANAAPKGEIWENAFAGRNALMVAMRSRQDKLSTWYSEKRNAYKDLKSLFGREFQFIDAIALMTDTDNSQKRAKAYYGDIYFSKK